MADYWWLVLVLIILGLLWKRGAIGRSVGSLFGRARGAFSPEGISLELAAAPQMLVNDQVPVEIRLARNGKPMRRLPGRKITIVFTEAPPAGTSLRCGRKAIGGVQQSLDVPLGRGGVARAVLCSGDAEGTVRFRAGWRTVLHSSGRVLSGRIVYSPEGQVLVAPLSGIVLSFMPENGVAEIGPLGAQGASPLLLVASLARNGLPFSGQRVGFYIRSFIPQGYHQSLPPGDMAQVRLSGGVHAINRVYDADSDAKDDYFELSTDANGQARVSLVPGVVCGSAAVCAEYRCVFVPVDVGIGVRLPHRQRNYVITVPILSARVRPGGFVFAAADVKLNNTRVSRPLVFRITDDGGTGSCLVDKDGTPVDEFVVRDRDLKDGLFLARVRFGDRPGRVAYAVSLADALSQAAPAQGALDITVDASPFIRNVWTAPLKLTRPGEVCTISVALGGVNMFGRKVEFELLKPDYSAVFVGPQGMEMVVFSAVSDLHGFVLVRLKAGDVSGIVKVKATLSPGDSVVIDVPVLLAVRPRKVIGSGGPFVIDVLPVPSFVLCGGSVLVGARVFKDDLPLPKGDLVSVCFMMTSAPAGCSLESVRHEGKSLVRRTGVGLEGSVIRLKEGVFSQVRFNAGNSPGCAVMRVKWSDGRNECVQDVVFDIVR